MNRDAINFHFLFLMKSSNNNLIIKYLKYRAIYTLTPDWTWSSILSAGSARTKLRYVWRSQSPSQQKDSAVLSGED